MTTNKINLTENDLHNIIKECLNNVLNEITCKAVKCDRYTVDDIRNVFFASDGVEGWIGQNIHPLRAEYKVPENMINPYGYTYAEWVEEYFTPQEIRCLEEDGMDINNPPTPGFHEVYSLESTTLYIYYNDGIYPLPAHGLKEEFISGGFFHNKKATEITNYIRVIGIGEYIYE